MSDHERIEKQATSREALAGAGTHPRSSSGAAIDAALMRYLAAEEYHEKVEEDRESGVDRRKDASH